MPEVTVLTAVRNGARYLPATIESVRAQSFRDWEYIVVDDASTDETPAIVESYARRDGRIRLVRRAESGGPFVAANEGLRHAAGAYVVRTDADDLSLPERVARQLAFIRARPGVRACATFCQGVDDAGPIAGALHTAPRTAGALRWYLCVRNPLVHSSACVERAALDAIGGYRELPLSQDSRLWCDLARAGWLAVLPEVLVHFRRHPRRLSHARAAEQRELGKEIIRDHLAALTGRAWSRAEADALYAVGHAEHFPVHAGLDAAARWDALWSADATLTAAERRELTELSAFRRRKFLRANARRQPLGFAHHIGRYLFPRPATRARS